MVNQEMFRPKICKTIFAVAETYLFAYINLLSIYVMPHATLIVRYLNSIKCWKNPRMKSKAGTLLGGY